MEIYSKEFVENLFNRMSKTYGMANYISSFGFTERWRNQCVREIDWTKTPKVGYDLMSGMGESWNLINRYAVEKHALIGIDLSSTMNSNAKEKVALYSNLKIQVQRQDILHNTIEDNSAEYILSTFGLKTFSSEQLQQLAKEIQRILKPGGQFSLIEISKPTNSILLLPYMFYLRYLIPLVGKLFMGNSADYRMLGIYCSKFGDCSKFKEYLEIEGLNVEMKSYFFGCATGVVGGKIMVN